MHDDILDKIEAVLSLIAFSIWFLSVLAGLWCWIKGPKS